jgi:hypothetical protein
MNQTMNDTVIEMFKHACDLLIEDGHDPEEYQFVEHTILSTLTYFRQRRQHEKSVFKDSEDGN